MGTHMQKAQLAAPLQHDIKAVAVMDHTHIKLVLAQLTRTASLIAKFPIQ